MAATTDVSLLNTFQKHIEDMRSLSLCKICIKPFYEPFILSCGHTFCYSCLASWFGGSRNRAKRKSCPECRTDIKVQPAPNYLLRDLVHMFISRAELLPEDETVKEHEQAKEEEAAQLATDRAGKTLFGGAFHAPHPADIPLRRILQAARLAPIRDAADDVVRCPHCTWELEDGICIHCGYGDESEDVSESDEDSDAEDSINSIDSELDADIDPIDHDFGHPIDVEIGYAGYSDDTGDQSEEYDGTPRPYGHDYEEEDEDMDGFIDDDDDEPDEDDVGDDDDDESDVTVTSIEDAASRIPYDGRRPEESSYGPDHAGGGSQGPWNHPAPGPTFYGVNTYEDESNETSTQATTYEESQDGLSESQTNNSDDDSIREVLPPPEARAIRKRRIVISDDEDDEEGEGVQSENDGETEETEGVDEEEDDDDGEEDPVIEASADIAIGPAQNSLRRQQHLNNQRARRNNHGYKSQNRDARTQYQSPQYARRGGYAGRQSNDGFQTPRRPRSNQTTRVY